MPQFALAFALFAQEAAARAETPRWALLFTLAIVCLAVSVMVIIVLAILLIVLLLRKKKNGRDGR